MKYSSLWVPALLELDGEGRSHYDYGHFFVTLNIANAYRYTIGNPYRSEFIQALAESLKVLAQIGDPLPMTVETEHPQVAHLINDPSPPVVLEMTGISRERLLNAKGGEDIEAELQSFIDMQMYPGVNACADFRIQSVTPADIMAVHDLRNWSAEDVGDSSWKPDVSKVAATRYSPQDWVSKAIG
jgi:hypothetical protein